jgi:hypothetical protein
MTTAPAHPGHQRAARPRRRHTDRRSQWQQCAHRSATGDRHGEGSALNNVGLALREVRRFEVTAGQLARL